MPLLKPEPNESRSDFLGRCVPEAVGGGMDQDQAVAACIAQFDRGNAAVEDDGLYALAKYSAEQLRKMVDNGHAMGPKSSPSYPIEDGEDLSNAISAVGRGSGDHDAIRRHIIKRARALGQSNKIPDNWNSDGSMKEASIVIAQDGDRWLVIRDGQLEYGANDYEDAVRHLASSLTLAYSTDSEAGLLPEEWYSPDGIAFSRALTGGRDFSNVQWSWRDPNASLVPLMFQTKNLPAHQEAELAGFVTQFSMPDGNTPKARGRFYDSPIGKQARDALLGGRRFGVSVGPSENVDYTASVECTEFGDDGVCLQGQERVAFDVYEIANLTMEPTPAFEEASIMLDTGQANVPSNAMPVMASVSVPTRPPAEWFSLPEPKPGVPFMDGAGDDVLITQPGGAPACPLTIRDDGLVFGHIYAKGTCHVGNPWGAGICATPPDQSPTAYALFHTGTVLCADDTMVATGVLCVGPEHAPERGSLFEVQGYYASAAFGWADVHVIDGEFGAWVCGALRPDVTEEEVRTLRALSLSGDWRGVGGRELDLAGVLAVNTPGLPITREVMVAGAGVKVGSPPLRASSHNGTPTVLQAAGIVARCSDCARRAILNAQEPDPVGSLLSVHQKLDQISAAIRVLDNRTRHLIPAEAQAIRDALSVNGAHAT